MFAFAIWDERRKAAFSAPVTGSGSSRSTTTVVDGAWSSARRRAKALVPFLPAIETDLDALKDYLAFQFCLAGKTLFRGIHELLPGHTLTIPQRRGAHRALLGGAVRA